MFETSTKHKEKLPAVKDNLLLKLKSGLACPSFISTLKREHKVIDEYLKNHQIDPDFLEKMFGVRELTSPRQFNIIEKKDAVTQKKLDDLKQTKKKEKFEQQQQMV